MNDHIPENVSDEMLMALADGELDSEQAVSLAARIERDAALAERYAVFSRTADALRAAFQQGDMPNHLIAAAMTTPVEPVGPEVGEAATVVSFQQRVAWPLALAASLAVGIGLGWGMKGVTGPTPTPGPNAIARSVSDIATGHSYEISGFGTARVLGSFETEQGLCRLIAVDPTKGTNGRFLACRTGSDWRVALSVSDSHDTAFTPASEAATEMVDIYLHAIDAGPALDLQAELQALR
ncbi:MAG: anti-sigma factor family protein [Pseudomonadota bacterium]